MRERGTGQVVFDASKGCFKARLRVGTLPNGRPKTKTVQAKTKAEAKRLLRRLQEEHDAQGEVVPSTLTFGDFAHHYFAHGATQRLRASTLTNHTYLLDRYLLPTLSNRPLDAISVAEVERLLYEHRRTLSASTVNLLRSVLSRLFNEAVRRGDLATSPVQAIPRFRARATERTLVKDPLDLEEVRLLLTKAKGNPLEAFIVIAVTTGMRRGEILALHFSDVDFDASTVTVKRSVSEVRTEGPEGTRSEVTYLPPKTRASERRLWLSPEAIGALDRQRAQHAVRFGARFDPSGPIFLNDGGNQVRPSLVSRRFRAFLTENDLRGVRIHDLRHTYATIGLNHGQRLEHIAQQLGHDSIRTTKDTYGKVAQQLAEASGRLMATTIFG